MVANVNPASFSVGDIIEMKKTHPCGGNQWQIIRTGADFRIKCVKCLHQVTLPRERFLKSIRYRSQADSK